MVLPSIVDGIFDKMEFNLTLRDYFASEQSMAVRVQQRAQKHPVFARADGQAGKRTDELASGWSGGRKLS